MPTQHIVMPAVYVGTYRKYNNGSLAGDWLVLNEYTSKEEFYQDCQKLHKEEADPEFMFQDWEGIPDSLIGESWISSEYWEFLEAEGDSEAKSAFIAWYGSWNAEVFEESYQGEYDSELEFSYHLIDDTGYLLEVSDTVARYFDYEAFSRDLFINDYSSFDGHVFLNI
jgi:antirestriction protein